MSKKGNISLAELTSSQRSYEEGKLKGALEVLKSYHSDVRRLLSVLAQIEREKRLGKISRETYKVERSDIGEGVLVIIDELAGIITQTKSASASEDLKKNKLGQIKAEKVINNQTDNTNGKDITTSNSNHDGKILDSFIQKLEKYINTMYDNKYFETEKIRSVAYLEEKGERLSINIKLLNELDSTSDIFNDEVIFLINSLESILENLKKELINANLRSSKLFSLISNINLSVIQASIWDIKYNSNHKQPTLSTKKLILNPLRLKVAYVTSEIEALKRIAIKIPLNN